MEAISLIPFVKDVMLINLWWFFIVTGVMSWAFTGLLRHYALAKSLIDIPNQRSSHSIPTPRGGGLAIVLTMLAILPVFAWLGWLPLGVTIGFGGAGGLVALVGFLDDHGHVRARWRLLAHFLAAAWGLYWLGGFPTINVFGFYLNLGWFGNVLSAIYLVWLLNLYNFMDGIDGIASIEAITVCFGGILMVWMVAPGEYVWSGSLLLLASVAGFLVWNYPPAKIFMGDAGSGFLGLMLGLLSIHAATANSKLFWGWMILLGAFIVDATVTLLRRLTNREKLYEAHRSHAYQYASRKLGSHEKVTLAYGIINLAWLLPLALCVAMGWLDGLVGVLISYTPLIIVAFYFKAGARKLQEV